jgi:serine/threonine protein kinase/tetratricopeptide (TPR) repeat protein
MPDPRHEQLRRLFDRAIELPAGARPAFLDSQCAGDADLKQRLLAMLAAADDERFLSVPTGPKPESATPAAEAPLREGPGNRIGPYKLLQLIGEGGFGAVFMAEQTEPVARKVALKIIKLGMDTRQVVARFEQERQALAMMDHPNIARVLDAGATETGRPYFVMDLVKGDPIVEYCDKNNLSIDERLDLFAQVCSAVQHAHGKGIIHRDIKPSNILVGTQDGRPQAKVIDFGIAKATSQKLTDKTLFTEHQQVIGTLQYMSPEQAEGSLDIDTRTDVYSLGVLLYELLTGSTPFDKKTLGNAMYGELQRMIREVEPPKPSTRLSDSHDTLASIAAHRRVEPKRLGTILRGDLDWIVMKALEKDRSRRYETANGLAADIRRYLGGEAVVAAPPSASYRLRKFVRRNQRVVAAAAAIAASLLIGVIAFAWQASIARIDRDRAVLAEAETKKRADELAKVADFQAGMLEQVDPTKAGQMLTDDVMAKFAAALAKAAVPEAERAAQTEAFRGQWVRVNATDAARELIDRTILRPAAAAIDDSFNDQPLVAARLRLTLGERCRGLGLTDAAEPLLTSALATRRRLLGDDHEDTLSAIECMALLLQEEQRRGDAEKLFAELLATSRRVLGEEHRLTLRTMFHIGELLHSVGKRSEAEQYFGAALEKLRRTCGEQHPATLSAKYDLALLLKDEDRMAEAEPLLREALQGYQTAMGEDHPVTLRALQSLANLLEHQGKLADAEQLYRQVLAVRRRVFGEEHPETLGAMNDLGLVLQVRGRPAEAESLLREVLEKRRRRFGDDHLDTVLVANNLGMLLEDDGRFTEAEPLLRESLERRRRLLGNDHPQTLIAINNLGTLLQTAGQLAEAEALCREALGKLRRVQGETHRETLGAINNLGVLLMDAGKPAEAEPFVREAMEKLQAVVGEQHPNAMSAIANLGVVLMKLNRLDEAETCFREALGKQRRALGDDHPSTLNTAVMLGGLLLERGRHEATVALLAPIETAGRRVFTDGNASVAGRLLLRLGSARGALARTASEFAAAEANILEADTILTASAASSSSARDARSLAKAFVGLYAAWDKLEPGGHDAKAAAWQTKLDALDGK